MSYGAVLWLECIIIFEVLIELLMALYFVLLRIFFLIRKFLTPITVGGNVSLIPSKANFIKKKWLNQAQRDQPPQSEVPLNMLPKFSSLPILNGTSIPKTPQLILNEWKTA